MYTKSEKTNRNTISPQGKKSKAVANNSKNIKGESCILPSYNKKLQVQLIASQHSPFQRMKNIQIIQRKEGFIVSENNDTHIHYWGKGGNEGHLKVNSETYNLQDINELREGINILGGIINGYLDRKRLSSKAQQRLIVLRTILKAAMKYYNKLKD